MTGPFGTDADLTDSDTEYGGAARTNSLPLRTGGTTADRPPRYPAPNGEHIPDDPGTRVAN
jgi:hypothetical protein